MLSKKNWEEFIFEFGWQKDRMHRKYNWQLKLYGNFLMTVGLTPVLLIVDLLIFPFEVGYLIFKKIISRKFDDSNER